MSKKNKKNSQTGKKHQPLTRSEKTGTGIKSGNPPKKPDIKPKTGKKVEPAKNKPWYKRGIYIGVIAVAVIIIIILAIFYILNLSSNTAAILSENITASPSSIVAPSGEIIVSDISVSDIYPTSMKIKWKTSIPCSSEAHATNTVNNVTVSSFPDPTLLKEHDVDIGWLSPDTEYQLTIVCKDKEGNEEKVAIDGTYRTSSAPAPLAISAGDSIPDFSLPDINGKTVSLSDFNNKWLIIVFWNLSCNACKEESKYIDEYNKNLNDPDIALITINVGSQANMVSSYMKSQNFSFPVLIDEEKTTSGHYTVEQFPATFLVSPDKIIKETKQSSFKSAQEIDDFVRAGMSNN